MAEEMEMFLEEIIKKTNPQEYIKILEQDREDFAEEINELQNRIDKAVEYIKKEEKANLDCNRKDVGLILMNYKRVLNILKGDNK